MSPGSLAGRGQWDFLQWVGFLSVGFSSCLNLVCKSFIRKVLSEQGRFGHAAVQPGREQNAKSSRSASSEVPPVAAVKPTHA
jgi:hypothetical protein